MTAADGQRGTRNVQKNEQLSVFGLMSTAITMKNKDLALQWFGFSFALHQPWKFGLAVTRNIQEQVDEHRAAMLLGLPKADLRRYSRVSGLGHLEKSDHGQQQMVFTYEELRLLCLLAAQSSK